MIGKNILVFGGSGQIGRHLIRRLTKNNHLVTVVTRNLHQKGAILKTQGNPGYLEVVEANIFDEKQLNNLFENKDICINLVGILYQKKKNTFKNIHDNFPTIISKICSKKKLEQFIHISALGIEKAKDSDYAISKLNGEKNIFNNFSKSTILRPSIVYSVDDNFTTNMMSLLSILPFFPLYYAGKTKFSPIHVSEMADIILNIVDKNICSEIIECAGPDVITFREIIEKLLILIDKKKMLLPLPLIIAKIGVALLEKFPRPLITMDQLKLLKYDNILNKENKSNFDLGIKSELKFEDEVKKYAYMWKKGGQYSR
jgi:NADH dehydrogenase